MAHHWSASTVGSPLTNIGASIGVCPFSLLSVPPPIAALTQFEMQELRRLASAQHPTLLRLRREANATDLSCETFVERLIWSTPLDMVNELQQLVAAESGRGRLGEDPNARIL